MTWLHLFKFQVFWNLTIKQIDDKDYNGDRNIHQKIKGVKATILFINRANSRILQTEDQPFHYCITVTVQSHLYNCLLE